MKWIKINSDEDYPKDANKEVVIRATFKSDAMADIGDVNRIKNLIDIGWDVEWLDESIDQQDNFLLEALADLCHLVGKEYGSSKEFKNARAAIEKAVANESIDQDEPNNGYNRLKDDWKEKFREWDKKRRFDMGITSEMFIEYFEENVLAPLLQKEYKGDDLVASDIKIASPVSTRPSGSSNSDGQVVSLVVALLNGKTLQKVHPIGELEYFWCEKHKGYHYFYVNGWGSALGTAKDRLFNLIDNPEHWSIKPNKEQEVQEPRRNEDATTTEARNQNKTSNSEATILSADDFEDSGFIPCNQCDGHDACEDFGCAIELGLGRMVSKC